MPNRSKPANVRWVFDLALLCAALVGFGLFSLLLRAQWLIAAATVVFSLVVAVAVLLALAVSGREQTE